MGKCPLTPEEAALVLAGLGFKHGTYIYLAGSEIYGGQSRMQALTTLYPNLVTKEDLLTPNELAPFRNFSSQVSCFLPLSDGNTHTYTLCVTLTTKAITFNAACSIRLHCMCNIRCICHDGLRKSAIIPGVGVQNILWWWSCSHIEA